MITRNTQTSNKQNDSSKSSQKPERNSPVHPLTINPTFPHTVPVGANHQQTAKFWDCYPTYDGNTVTLRRFFYVCRMLARLMPGMRGLQDGVNRNKRDRLISDNSTRQICPNVKTYETEKMNALTMGNTARNPLAYLPHLPLAPVGRKPKAPPATLAFKPYSTGFIAYRAEIPVAWIVAGHHKGQLGNQPKTARFVDVAYHRKTDHGINLETFEAATVAQAIIALETIFGGAAA